MHPNSLALSFSEPLRIRTSGVVLRGSGRDVTILRKQGCDRGALVYVEGIHDLVAKDTFDLAALAINTLDLSGAAAASLQPGDRLMLWRPSPIEWIRSLGCESFGGGKEMGYWGWHAGDIDVWVDAPAQDIIQYVHQLCPDSHVVYHHIDFPIWDDISIELHFFPSFLYAPDNDRRLQEFFEKNKERIMQHQVTLADGKSVVTCPDSEFNAVYLLCHMFNHLMEELIVMRQYLDYYYVLRDIKDDETRRRVAEDVGRIGLNTLAGGVMYVMGEFFGLEKEYMFVEPDEKIGRFLQKEIMRGDAIEELEHRNNQGSFSHFVDRTRRSFATMRYFPKESAWSPVTRARHWICRWKRSK